MSASGCRAYASGGRLIATDPTGATLYLAGTEIHRDTTGALTATRFYASCAVRTSTSGLTWLAADQRGPGDLAIKASTLASTRRKTDPFGNPRQHTHLAHHPRLPNGITDPTGLR
jgi:hypothetical protein